MTDEGSLAAMILGDVPGLVPGAVVAIGLATFGASTVARALRCRAVVAWLLVATTGVILAATLTPQVCDCRLPVARVCDMSRVGLPSMDELLGPGDVAANIVVFMPLGFAIALVPASRRRAAVLVAAIALPFAIEGIQLVAVPLNRACQSFDVVDNLTGLALGLLVGTLLARVRPSVRRVAEPLPRGGDDPSGAA